MQRVSAECAWPPGCGQPARLDVLVSVPGEPPRPAMRVSSFCMGHVVIVGIDTQARHGGELWYAAPLEVGCWR